MASLEAFLPSSRLLRTFPSMKLLGTKLWIRWSAYCIFFSFLSLTIAQRIFALVTLGLLRSKFADKVQLRRNDCASSCKHDISSRKSLLCSIHVVVLAAHRKTPDTECIFRVFERSEFHHSKRLIQNVATHSKMLEKYSFLRFWWIIEKVANTSPELASFSINENQKIPFRLTVCGSTLCGLAERAVASFHRAK